MLYKASDKLVQSSKMTHITIFALHSVFFFPQISYTLSDLLTTILKHLKQIMGKKQHEHFGEGGSSTLKRNRALGQEGS
jgi:hypothetical protein